MKNSKLDKSKIKKIILVILIIVCVIIVFYEKRKIDNRNSIIEKVKSESIENPSITDLN